MALRLAMLAKSLHYKALYALGVDKDTIRETPLHKLFVAIVYRELMKGE